MLLTGHAVDRFSKQMGKAEVTDVKLEEVRAEALRKLGRNIVNFSKIEALLKVILTMSRLDADSAITLPKEAKFRKKKLSKQTLGTLVAQLQDIMTDDPEQSEASVDENKDFSISVKFTLNAEFLSSKKEALKKLVAERNRLIHKDLAYLDSTSVSACQKLIGVLDEQNPRLLRQIEDLGWMASSLRRILEDVQEQLRRQPDFLERLQQESCNDHSKRTAHPPDVAQGRSLKDDCSVSEDTG